MSRALSKSDPVAVIGAGAMGAGIAQIAAAAGHPVRLFDMNVQAAQKAVSGIRSTFVKLADKGRMTAADADAAGDRLSVVDDIAQLAGSALVIEAIVENLQTKQKLFAALEAIVADECILATNTSSISVTAIGAALRLPARLLGMHFFNPAPLMALVEVVSGLATDREMAQVIYDTALAWGKSPVHTRSTPGFIVNRVARPFYAEALRLMNEGAADPATIDAVMRDSGGFRMGPFELMDLIGHDVNYAVTRSVFESYSNDPRFTPSLIQQELVNAGFLGRKSGRGFYPYGEGATVPAPQTENAVSLPANVVLWRGTAIADGLAERLRASSVSFELRETPHSDGRLLDAGDATVYLTDGRSATQRASETGQHAIVLLDLVFDISKSRRVALTVADQAGATDFEPAVAVFQAAGFAVSRLQDVPGMAVMRTVAMLANEAADAVNQGVCDAAAADLAMLKGVNYPRGPLAWADAIGLPHVLGVLDSLAAVYGEDRYRASPLIRRKVWGKGRFHG